MTKKVNKLLGFVLILFFSFSNLQPASAVIAYLCCTDPPMSYTCHSGGESSQAWGWITCGGETTYCTTWNQDGSGC